MPSAIELREILTEAVNFNTAHVQEHYPFGRQRCLRKIWVETAEKGAKKNQQRVVTCTTKKGFNEQYTHQITDKGLKLLSDSTGAPPNSELGVLELISISRVIENMTGHWNKPHPGQYSPMVTLFKNAGPDNRIFIKQFSLSMYSNPLHFAAFRALLAGEDLQALYYGDARARYKGLEELNRRSSPTSWQQWESFMAAERAAQVEDYVRGYTEVREEE